MKIAHLYYDLANLYGERGNVAVLRHALEDQGIDVTVDKITVNDAFQPADYDFIYIGAMTEANQSLVFADLLTHQQQLARYIMDGGFLLATGNALEFFGKIWNNNGKEEYGLRICSYSAKKLEKRLMAEVIVSNDTLKEVCGFQNQSCGIVENDHPWFTGTELGMGSYPDSNQEGVKFNHFYGTYVIGPVLARNPHVTQHLVKEWMMSHNVGGYTEKIKEFDKKAYESYKNSIKKVD
ncbi:MAG: hypothetical protein HUJ58_09035 [Erysipelotrichaceae bacterium]|nr:hypothetical protein [Erysipelotrichaceae bacterium]